MYKTAKFLEDNVRDKRPGVGKSLRGWGNGKSHWTAHVKYARFTVYK